MELLARLASYSEQIGATLQVVAFATPGQAFMAMLLTHVRFMPSSGEFD